MNHTDAHWTEEHQANSEPDFYGKWIDAEKVKPGCASGFDVWVYCHDIVSFWQQKLHWNGSNWIHNGGEVFPPIVTHWMMLPPNPIIK